MMFLLLLVATTVLASGPPIPLDDPSICLDTFGVLDGRDYPNFGGDCCSFAICDHTRGNKTAYLGKCMGGTAWNHALLVCDYPKYVTDCDPAVDCDIPKRTPAECANPPSSSSCCVGAKVDQGFNGYEPEYSSDDGGLTYYITEAGPRFAVSCPHGQVFSLGDCCCEFDLSADIDPVCDDVSVSYVFSNPDDPCCSYAQCWANRTGYDVVPCMPPSVWNDEVKACDLAINVMACMNEFCGDEMTDEPCVDGLAGDCCRGGNYFEAGIDPTQYFIVAGPAASDRALCCPEDMNGVQLEFNNAVDVCACEAP